MKHKLRCYLAGSVAHLTWDEAMRWRRAFAGRLRRAGFEPLIPCEAEKVARNNGPMVAADSTAPGCSNQEIFARDLNMLWDADVVVANLRGAERASLGTAWELGWAYSNGVPIIAVVQPGDLHWHAFIIQSCTIVPTLDAAMRELKVLQKERSR
ncbi:MAG: nucleoside 2-deoxyribosyltransferase [bacterium]